MHRHTNLIVGLLATLALAASACDPGTADRLANNDGETDKRTVVVGSRDFGESKILAQVYGQAVATEGFTVQYRQLGGYRDRVYTSFAAGDIDMTPEYAASALEFLNEEAGRSSSDTEATSALLRTQLALIGLVALAPAPAMTTDTEVVATDTGGPPFAADHVIPVLTEQLADSGGESLESVIDLVSRSITTEKLRAMNARLDLDHDAPETIAKDFLTEHGLLK